MVEKSYNIIFRVNVFLKFDLTMTCDLCIILKTLKWLAMWVCLKTNGTRNVSKTCLSIWSQCQYKQSFVIRGTSYIHFKVLNIRGKFFNSFILSHFFLVFEMFFLSHMNSKCSIRLLKDYNFLKKNTFVTRKMNVNESPLKELKFFMMVIEIC